MLIYCLSSDVLFGACPQYFCPYKVTGFITDMIIALVHLQPYKMAKMYYNDHTLAPAVQIQYSIHLFQTTFTRITIAVVNFHCKPGYIFLWIAAQNFMQ